MVENPKPSGARNEKLELVGVVQFGNDHCFSSPKPVPVLSFTRSFGSPGTLSTWSGSPSPLTSMRSTQFRVTDQVGPPPPPITPRFTPPLAVTVPVSCSLTTFVL